jgi:hypothetical protein
MYAEHEDTEPTERKHLAAYNYVGADSDGIETAAAVVALILGMTEFEARWGRKLHVSSPDVLVTMQLDSHPKPDCDHCGYTHPSRRAR